MHEYAIKHLKWNFGLSAKKNHNLRQISDNDLELHGFSKILVRLMRQMEKWGNCSAHLYTSHNNKYQNKHRVVPIVQDH